jgi:lysophospholipase L1-like esterase
MTKPLRLLVIGDSLAAGVGTSQSSTPILPQSIASALSAASDGRAVHWTCIGTPGASASQIVHDLGAYEETPSLLELRYAEWQARKKKAQDWWEHRKRVREQQENEKNRVKQWWSRLRKDVDELKDVLHVDKEQVVLQSRLTRRKTTLDPDLKAQYDIAVVLTGFNDLKDTFLPLMMMGQNASTNPSAEDKPGSLKDALVRIIHALQKKMKLDLPNDHEDGSNIATSPTTIAHHRGPLVVFPAIPASPLPLTQYPPLSWFLIPLLRMMDNNKKLLAERFPGLVLFVDPPSPSEFRDIEAGRGELHASRRAENVLLQLTNVTQRAQEKVKELMDQHYKSPTKKDDDDGANEEDNRTLVYEQSCREHQLVESKNTPGATLLAEDRMHPNDQGYDFWGRHIAAAIVKEWNKDTR